MKPGLARVLVKVGIFFAVISLLLGLVAPFQVPLTLLFGWAPSSARLLGAWHPNLQTMAMLGLALIGLVAGTHGFMRWLYASLADDGKNPRFPIWPWRWSLCGFGIAFCALLAMGAAMLTTHQIYWLSKTDQPWFVSSRQRFEILLAAIEFRKQAETLRWSSAETRAAFWGMRLSNSQPVGEQFQPVWIEKDKTTLQAVLLIPRRRAFEGRAGFVVIQPGNKYYERQKLESLPTVLASFGIGILSEGSAKLYMTSP